MKKPILNLVIMSIVILACSLHLLYGTNSYVNVACVAVLLAMIEPFFWNLKQLEK